MYARKPTSRLRRLVLHDFPGLLICFRCAQADGQMTGVSPARTCRNYRKRRQPPKQAKPLANPSLRKQQATRPKKPREDECRIPLSNGMFALVDPEDFAEMSTYNWYAIGKSPHISAARRHKRQIIYLHRQIMKARPGQFVDHKDCDRLNNHRDNLRFCTWQQNQANRHSRRGSSAFVGVSPCGDTWKADITSRRKYYYVGLFDNELEAAKARDRKAYELNGEFAYLNFPEDYGR